MLFRSIRVTNPGCFSIEVPFDKDEIVMTGKTYKITMTPETEEVQAIFLQMKEYLKEIRSDEGTIDREAFADTLEEKMALWANAMKDVMADDVKLPIQLTTTFDESYQNIYTQESVKIKVVSDQIIII